MIKPNFKLCTKKCSECLFTPNRIVSNERASAIIRKCVEEDDYFECHKGNEVNEKWVCRGFYDGVQTPLMMQLKYIEDQVPTVEPD